MADLFPNGFIWTPFCPDLDQAIFEPRYTFPKLWQICFQMASFGHLSVQIWIKPFSTPDASSFGPILFVPEAQSVHLGALRAFGAQAIIFVVLEISWR